MENNATITLSAENTWVCKNRLGHIFMGVVTVPYAGKLPLAGVEGQVIAISFAGCIPTLSIIHLLA